jgi:DnaJ-class molecular chaperone
MLHSYRYILNQHEIRSRLFLCCLESFLGSDDSGPDGRLYSLLSLERDADKDGIKKAYKRQSLQMHPDKLAQRGQLSRQPIKRSLRE